jgi:tartrate-resistant acid phosphatase type 5
MPTVRFVALGDYGVGIREDSESSRRQRRIADVLDTVVSHHDARFVVSLGDNVYRGEGGFTDEEGGGEDDDWYSSFFQPYRYALARVPFFPAIGNHDEDMDGSDNREQLEDNHHLQQRFTHEPDRSSSREPGLFYRLHYGRNVELVCLDTSHDSADTGVARYFQAPGHQGWLEETFGARDARWLIPFSHHSVYCAGPEHHNDDEMQVLVPLFDRAGVRLVLAGHEHNFQLNEMDGRSYVVSGAGAKLREERPDGLDAAGTAGWCAQAHLLLVDIDRDEARLTPVSGLLPDGTLQLMTIVSPGNEIIDPPFVVR